MKKSTSATQPRDFDSIKAFLKAHLPKHRTMALMTTDGYHQTINGVNAIIVMANTRGTSEIIRERVCGGKPRGRGALRSRYDATSIHVESESTPTHATLAYLISHIERRDGGRIVGRSLPQHAFPSC